MNNVDIGLENKSVFAPYERFSVGKTLKVAVEEWKPHITVDTLTNGTVTARGPMFSMLELLSKALNFRYELYRPMDGLWGEPDNSQVWNGMIGMVRRNEVDIALGPFIISESRSSAVQFSSIFLTDYFRMMFAREIRKEDPLSFLKVFAKQVWIGVAVSILAISLLVLSINQLEEPKYKIYNYSALENGFKIILDIFGAFLSQVTRYGHGKIIRFALLCIYILNIVVMKNFSSSLTSRLAVKVSPRPFTTFQDVINAQNYTIVLEASTAITNAIKTSKLNSTIFGKLQKKMAGNRLMEVKASNLHDFTEEEIKYKKMALLVEEITCMKFTSDFYSSSGHCEYYLAKEKILPSQFGIIGQKGSDVIPRLNAVISNIVEAELYRTWLDKEIPNASTCLDPSSFREFSVHSYGLKGLWVMFAMHLSGLLLSIILFVLEYFSRVGLQSL